MTSFGRAQVVDLGFSVTVEIRTLNGRSLDIVMRLPKNYLEFEEALRKQISQTLRRGRIEVFVQIDTTLASQKVPRINLELARFYWDQLQDLHRQLPGAEPPTLDSLMRIPYIFEPAEQQSTDREALKEILTRATTEAMEQIHKMRILEGEALAKDCLVRIEALSEELAAIESRKDQMLQEYKDRLRERIQELLGDTAVEESRFLQEVACMAERSDVNEEIVRLKSHLNQIRALLSGSTEADGRRLDFLAQELHREVNTIGCKTGDLETNQTVVRMKSEVGKLKEQVQNIE